MISQDRVKDVFEYNPDTGSLLRKKHKCLNLRGVEAGWRHKGYKTDYIRVRVDGEVHFAHRLIWLYMTGVWPRVVDHIDRDGLNNRWDNLRDTDSSGNGHNRGPNTNSKSGVLGVHYLAVSGRWRAYITHDWQQENLGCFDNLFDAVCARKSAENHVGGINGQNQVR
jgi:hypothetical protein